MAAHRGAMPAHRGERVARLVAARLVPAAAPIAAARAADPAGSGEARAAAATEAQAVVAGRGAVDLAGPGSAAGISARGRTATRAAKAAPTGTGPGSSGRASADRLPAAVLGAAAPRDRDQADSGRTGPGSATPGPVRNTTRSPPGTRACRPACVTTSRASLAGRAPRAHGWNDPRARRPNDRRTHGAALSGPPNPSPERRAPGRPLRRSTRARSSSRVGVPSRKRSPRGGPRAASS